MCDDEINRVPQEHLGLFIANSHGMYICYQCAEHVLPGLGSDSYSYYVIYIIYMYTNIRLPYTHAR